MELDSSLPAISQDCRFTREESDVRISSLNMEPSLDTINPLRDDHSKAESRNPPETGSQAPVAKGATGNAEVFDFLLFIRIYGPSAFFAFVVVAMPLSGSEQSEIHPVAFLFFHVLYALGAGTNVRYFFHFTLPPPPVWYQQLVLISSVILSLTIILLLLYGSRATENALRQMQSVRSDQMLIGFITLYAIFYLAYASVEDRTLKALLSEEQLSDSTSLSTRQTVHFRLSSHGVDSSVRKSIPSLTSQSISNANPGSAKDSISDATGGTVPKQNDKMATIFSFSSFRTVIEEYSCLMVASPWRVPLKACGKRELLGIHGYSVLWNGIKAVICMEDTADELKFNIIGRAGSQMLRGVAMVALNVFVLYGAGQLLLTNFNTAASNFGEAGVYLLLVIVVTVARLLFRLIGARIDSFKTGGPSMQLLMEMWVSMFYYTLYRNLFIRVRSYEVFFTIKALHVLQEMMIFRMRYTDFFRYFFEKAYEAIESMDPGRMKLLLQAVIGPRIKVQLQRLDILLGMRFHLILYTSTVFMILFTFLRFGYNRSHYCFYAAVEEQQYERLMIFTALSIFIEVLLFFYLNYCSKQGREVSAFTVWQRLLLGGFQTPWRVLLISLLWVTCHVTVDIYVPRMDLSDLIANMPGCAES